MSDLPPAVQEVVDELREEFEEAFELNEGEDRAQEEYWNGALDALHRLETTYEE